MNQQIVIIVASSMYYIVSMAINGVLIKFIIKLFTIPMKYHTHKYIYCNLLYLISNEN